MKKFVFSLFVAVFVALSTSVGYAENWQWISSNNECAYFFDKLFIHYNIKHDPLDYSKTTIDTTKISFWEKTFYTERGAKIAAEAFKDFHFFTLHHSISYRTYSIPDRSETTHIISFYDKDGNKIQEYHNDFVYEIQPNTWGDMMFKTICNYASEHHDELEKNAYDYSF